MKAPTKQIAFVFRLIVGRLRRWHIGNRLRRHLRNWREVRDAYFDCSHIPSFDFRNGIHLHHDVGDAPVYLLLEIFDDKSYQPKSARSVKYILDLGANVGFFCAWISTQYPEASVLAFEPGVSTFKKLEENIGQNNLKGVTMRNEAVAKHAGAAEFFESRTSVISSLSEVQLIDQGDGMQYTVKTRSLANCIELSGANRIDLL